MGTKSKTVRDSVVGHYEMAVKFQQRSAEVYALQIQAYNVAKHKLDYHLANRKENDKKPAVVIDLDETVLNNMPFVAQGIEEKFDYTEWGTEWDKWVDAACADLIPGSKDFLQYADKKGAEIFYVSNRLTKEFDATVENLKNTGLPQVIDDHVLLWGEFGTKKDRRDSIKKDHELVLIIGNSLYDLSSVFINEDTEEQVKTVEQYAENFGDRFILLPNSSYGDYWVDASLDP